MINSRNKNFYVMYSSAFKLQVYLFRFDIISMIEKGTRQENIHLIELPSLKVVFDSKFEEI